MFTLDQIDLSELADLLDQRDYGAGYLDPATGEIYPAFDGHIVGRDEDEPVDTGDADTDGLIALGGESGREVYRDMQSFTDAIGDRRLRDQLTSALDGPKPMRAFRSAVHSTPERLGSTWQQFRNSAHRCGPSTFSAPRELAASRWSARSRWRDAAPSWSTRPMPASLA